MEAKLLSKEVGATSKAPFKRSGGYVPHVLYSTWNPFPVLSLVMRLVVTRLIAKPQTY